jgi:hypothetical protein
VRQPESYITQTLQQKLLEKKRQQTESARKGRSRRRISANRRVVVDLTEDEPKVTQLKQRTRTVLDEREISALPLPGKVVVADSSLVNLRGHLTYAPYYSDYFETQKNGDCSFVSINNLWVGGPMLTPELMNKIQERAKKKQPSKAHLYVCLNLFGLLTNFCRTETKNVVGFLIFYMKPVIAEKYIS